MDIASSSITATSTLIATLTSTALESISTSLGDGWSEWDDNGGVFGNGTDPIPDVGQAEGNYVLNTLIGLIIVIIASALNALGLNLTKLDHLTQQSVPKRERRPQWMRWRWIVGMGTYIGSQVFGSPLALRYMRPDWVAPLGSSALVFNFLFARWLVGTPVSTSDVRGTALIVLGVILILIFSSINHGLDQSLSISRLNSLWTRASWLAYFPLLVLLTFITYLFSHLLATILKSRASLSPLPSPNAEFPIPISRSKPPHAVKGFFLRCWKTWKMLEKVLLDRLERTTVRTDDARLTWLQGVGWAVAGGSLAGLCLVFTKAVVKIFWLPGHPLIHPSAIITLVLLIATAVLQIVCLDRGLKCADTVVIVPVFYAGYTVLGFINSLIFYNETGQYARWILIAVFISIAVLISGVVLLSLKPSASTAADPNTISTQPNPSLRLRPRARGQVGGADEEGEAGPSSKLDEAEEGDRSHDVLWEVGSMSEGTDDEGDLKDEDRDGEKRLGVGGTKGSRGERGGLLFNPEEGEEDDGPTPTRANFEVTGLTAEQRNPFVDTVRIQEEEDDFGEYEGVDKDVSELGDRVELPK